MQTIQQIVHDAGRTRPRDLGRPFDRVRRGFFSRLLWAFWH